MEVARQGGVFWLKQKYFPLSVLSYFYRYSVDSKIFLKDEALKKKANIQLSHLLCVSVVLFSCVVFWLFFILFFSIVSEAGASIYSVSPEAAKEMPDLDPNLRSAGMKCIYFITVSTQSSSISSQMVLLMMLSIIILKTIKKWRFWMSCF